MLRCVYLFYVTHNKWPQVSLGPSPLKETPTWFTDRPFLLILSSSQTARCHMSNGNGSEWGMLCVYLCWGVVGVDWLFGSEKRNLAPWDNGSPLASLHSSAPKSVLRRLKQDAESAGGQRPTVQLQVLSFPHLKCPSSAQTSSMDNFIDWRRKKKTL